MRRLRLGFGIVAVPIIACAQPSGSGFEVVVAPLQLPGIGAACYDLAVYAGNGATRQTVWTHGDVTRTALGQDQTLPPAPTNPTPGPQDGDTLCSTQYGNAGGGDISYVGTCDASNDSDLSQPGVQNDVTVWFDGLYMVDGTEPKAEIGQWRDPCPDGCTLSVDCSENEDTLVRFDFTVMREAQQGFFDIAVNFEDVFCSAKVDCEYADGRPIKALFDANGDRQQTAVAALACTAGAGEDTGTVLHMNGVRIECGEGGTSSETLALPLTCVEGEGAFGMYATGLDGAPVVSPIMWDADGDDTLLPTRQGDIGGVVGRRMDDTHVIGFVFGPQSDGFRSDAYLAIWTKSGASWVLSEVADDPALVDFFEGFDCGGTLAAGRCVANGNGFTVTSWELVGGAIGPTVVVSDAPGYEDCSALSFAGYSAQSAFARCTLNGNDVPLAYALGDGSYTALPMPTGTAVLPDPLSTNLDTIEAAGPNSAVGLIGFKGDVDDPSPVRLVAWGYDGNGYAVSELSESDYSAFEVHDGAVFARRDQSDELFLFDSAWQRFTTFELDSSVVDVTLHGFMPELGAHGLVYGIYRDGIGDRFPFYAFVPASGAVTIVPLPVPNDLDPSLEVSFEGDTSNTSERRVAFGFHELVDNGWHTRMFVWSLAATGVTTWEALPIDLRPNDLAGLAANWTTYSTRIDLGTVPSCAALVGTTPTADAAFPSLWSWPPASAGDLATVTELALPAASSGSGEHIVVDLDPTVEGNGYSPVRTGEAVWQYAIYRGSEALTCDGAPCNKVFWNTAVGFDPTIPDCRLIMQATAAAAPGLVDGTTPGGVYPVITFDVPLTAQVGNEVQVVCEQDPLDGEGSGVTTGYTPFGEPSTFCFSFDGSIATSLVDCAWTSPGGDGGGGGGGGQPQTDCNDDGDCNDGLSCTTDTCKQNICAHNSIPNCSE